MKKIIALIPAFFLTLAAWGLDAKGVSKMKISIQITRDGQSQTIGASLTDNSSAAAFYEALKKAPVKVKMKDYGNFEKVGPLGQSFPKNDEPITTSPGDIILYQGNQITIYYDKNSWTFTRLGKIDGLSQAQLKKILGPGDITAVFSAEQSQ